MKKTSLFLLIFLIPVLFQVSCKKDKDPVPENTYKQPASRTEVVAIPAGLEAKAQTDDGANMAVMYIGLANAFSSMGSFFIVPSNAQIQSKKDGSNIYFWSSGGYSYWVTYSELSDKNTWKCEWEFPGKPKFTYIIAEEAKNGKSGNWTIFDPDATAQEQWTYNWAIDGANTYSANLVMSDSDYQSTFETVARADHSGSFKVKEDAVLTADVVWNVDGSGTYTFFGGLESFSGSWTAK